MKTKLSAALAAFFMFFVIFTPIQTHAATDEEIMMLTYIVHAEAGNQDHIGKRLVVDTVLNRVDSPQFPNTIQEVIFQPWQFSPVHDGAYYRAMYEWTQDDYQAVIESLNERVDYNVVFFQMYYFSPWGTAAYKHGDHYFSYVK